MSLAYTLDEIAERFSLLGKGGKPSRTSARKLVHAALPILKAENAVVNLPQQGGALADP